MKGNQIAFAVILGLGLTLIYVLQLWLNGLSVRDRSDLDLMQDMSTTMMDEEALPNNSNSVVE